MKAFKLFAISSFIVLGIFACAKDKKLEKQLENSEWNIYRYESYTFIGGVQDNSQDIDQSNAGFLKLNGKGEMIISNGPFTGTYSIEK